MGNAFSNMDMGLTRPPDSATPVTPGSSPLAKVTRSVYVGVGGDIQVTMAGNGETVIYKNFPTGQRLSGSFTHILATATTAADILAEW